METAKNSDTSLARSPSIAEALSCFYRYYRLRRNTGKFSCIIDSKRTMYCCDGAVFEMCADGTVNIIVPNQENTAINDVIESFNAPANKEPYFSQFKAIILDFTRYI